LSLEIEVNQHNFNKKLLEQKEEIAELKIGSFFLKKPVENQSLNIHVATGPYKLLSY
jgi:hypothetical protein